MSKAQVYETLPYDLSGSRSKNRFRNELLWGLEKLYEVYKTRENFCIVFDYACDIEIHFDNRFEFYQIKTSNKGSAYTIGKISDPDKQGNSILGKVYILKKIIDETNKFENTKIAIVVNVPLKTLDKTIHSSVKELNLNTLKDIQSQKEKTTSKKIFIETQSKDKIIENLKAEVKSEIIDLSEVYYINSTLDLVNPENTLIGETVKFIEEITGKEAVRVITLYRILTDMINEKACYELACNNYNDIEKFKGITKEEFESILKRTVHISNNYIKEAKKLVEDNYKSFYEQTKLTIGISSIVKSLNNNLVLHNLKEKIIDYIKENIEEFICEFKEIVEKILSVFNEEFPIEYSEHEKVALIILMLAKYKEDLNE
ncbi:dsDNA nuclease domain-containing protein [Clostridium celatum]|uniref:dsDNA nuclease domain-containing protein n=1 Tax=Clostridium celatum TaxID=36834 RepID=UPI000822C6C8|nr:dsDNA nuclease domain-containing protein [Clostridium celatum]MDU6295736.1 dsDNA nuclease domain-containing protein [Clostridium celatum]SCJ53803.1 Uncharacterised protein [uncultured Clostridium sp.]